MRIRSLADLISDLVINQAQRCSQCLMGRLGVLPNGLCTGHAVCTVARITGIAIIAKQLLRLVHPTPVLVSFKLVEIRQLD